MVINNFPIKFSVRPELVEGWTENSGLMGSCCHPFMLRRTQNERVTAFREVIFDGIPSAWRYIQTGRQRHGRL